MYKSSRYALLFLYLVVLSLGCVVWAETQDPTAPPFLNKPVSKKAAPVQLENLVLSSILVAPQRRTAVINKRAVSEGETVGGAVVLRIYTNEVRLRRAGQEFSLFLLDAALDKKPRRPADQIHILP